MADDDADTPTTERTSKRKSGPPPPPNLDGSSPNPTVSSFRPTAETDASKDASSPDQPDQPSDALPQAGSLPPSTSSELLGEGIRSPRGAFERVKSPRSHVPRSSSAELLGLAELPTREEQDISTEGWEARGQEAKHKREAVNAQNEAQDWYNRFLAASEERDEAKVKLEESVKDNAKLKTELDDRGREAKSLTLQIDDLKKESDEKGTTIRKLKHEVDAEKSKLQTIDGELVSLHSELHDEKQAREQAETHRDELEAQNLALLDDNKELADAQSAASTQAIANSDAEAKLRQVLDTFRTAFAEQSELVDIDMFLERLRDSQPQLRLPRNESQTSITNRDSHDFSQDKGIDIPKARDRQISLSDELNGHNASGYESDELSEDHDPELFGTGKEEPSDIYSDMGDDTIGTPTDRSRYTNQIFEGEARNHSSKGAPGRSMATQTDLSRAKGDIGYKDSWTPDLSGPNPDPPEAIESEEVSHLKTQVQQLNEASDAAKVKHAELVNKLTVRNTDWNREKAKSEERLKTIVSLNKEIQRLRDDRDAEISRVVKSKDRTIDAIMANREREVKRLKETNEDLSRSLTKAQSQLPSQPLQNLGLSAVDSISSTPTSAQATTSQGHQSGQQNFGLAPIMSVSTKPSTPQATLLQSNRRRDANLAPVKWQLALWGLLMAIMAYLYYQVLWEREMWRSGNEVAYDWVARATAGQRWEWAWLSDFESWVQVDGYLPG